ncbi:MAG: hypothetical protein V1809_05205 [Planctomycetota bacterium]
MITPERIIGGRRCVSTTPTTVFCLLFIVLFAIGITAAIYSVISVSPVSQPGYTMRMRSPQGYANNRLFYLAVGSILLACAPGFAGLTGLDRLKKKYGLRSRQIRFFAWVAFGTDDPGAQATGLTGR